MKSILLQFDWNCFVIFPQFFKIILNSKQNTLSEFIEYDLFFVFVFWIHLGGNYFFNGELKIFKTIVKTLLVQNICFVTSMLLLFFIIIFFIFIIFITLIYFFYTYIFFLQFCFHFSPRVTNAKLTFYTFAMRSHFFVIWSNIMRVCIFFISNFFFLFGNLVFVSFHCVKLFSEIFKRKNWILFLWNICLCVNVFFCLNSYFF